MASISLWIQGLISTLFCSFKCTADWNIISWPTRCLADVTQTYIHSGRISNRSCVSQMQQFILVQWFISDKENFTFTSLPGSASNAFTYAWFAVCSGGGGHLLLWLRLRGAAADWAACESFWTGGAHCSGWLGRVMTWAFMSKSPKIYSNTRKSC